MVSVELTNDEWLWVIGTLEYVGDFAPPEQVAVDSIKAQIDPNYTPPERPPLNDAILEVFIDRAEYVLSDMSWAMKHSQGVLSPAGLDALVQARQKQADVLVGLSGRFGE